MASESVFDIAIKRPSPRLDSTGDESGSYVQNAATAILRAVESLFDLLPAIKALRREYILDLEAQTARDPSISSPQSTLVASNSTPSSSVVDGVFDKTYSSYLIDKVVHDAGMMADRIQKEEIERKMKGQTIDEAYSVVIRKQREKLEEFRDTIKRRPPKNWSSKDFTKVEQILRDLSTKFEVTTLDSVQEKKTSQASLL